MQFTVCELNSPPIKSLIEQNYIPWYCDVDTSTEWYPYATKLGSFSLPLISIIDPADSENYLERTTGVQAEIEFYARLQVHASSEETEYQLRIVKSGTGTGTIVTSSDEVKCEATCDEVSATLPASTTVTLSAIPADGSVFNGFIGGDCDGEESCEVTMQSDITVTAFFSERQSQGTNSILIPLIQRLLQADEK